MVIGPRFLTDRRRSAAGRRAWEELGRWPALLRGTTGQAAACRAASLTSLRLLGSASLTSLCLLGSAPLTSLRLLGSAP